MVRRSSRVRPFRRVRIVRPGFKYRTIQASPVADSGGVVAHLTAVAAGPEAGERIGLRFTVRYLVMRIQANISASATNTFLRFIIFTDKQQVADSNPLISQLLNTSVWTQDQLAFKNIFTLERFHILKDWFISMDKISKSTYTKTLYYPFRNGLRVSYNGPLDTDVETNGLYLCVISNEPTNIPTVVVMSRVAYTDI